MVFGKREDNFRPSSRTRNNSSNPNKFNPEPLSSSSNSNSNNNSNSLNLTNVNFDEDLRRSKHRNFYSPGHNSPNSPTSHSYSNTSNTTHTTTNPCNIAHDTNYPVDPVNTLENLDKGGKEENEKLERNVGERVWRYRGRELSDERRLVILVRCLDSDVTEEHIESVVSEIAIKNGFSTPNSVTVASFHTNNISGELTKVTQNLGHSGHSLPIGHSVHTVPYVIERVGVVKFPSSSAADRFMSATRKHIKINSRDYHIQYDNTNSVDNVNSVNSGDTVGERVELIEAMSDVTSLLERRRLNSDWTCPSCRFLNFARRLVCLTCGLPKPTDEEVEIQNKAIEIEAINQAKILQSSMSDFSPWLIVKNLTNTSDICKIVNTLNTITNSPILRIIHIKDSEITGNSGNTSDGVNTDSVKSGNVVNTVKSGRGFMFVVYGGNEVVEEFVRVRGVRTFLLRCDGVYHRVDTVNSREKHAAEELFKRIKFISSKLSISSHNLHSTHSAHSLHTIESIESGNSVESVDSTMIRMRSTTLGMVWCHLGVSDPHGIVERYIRSWMSEWILVSSKPDVGTFQYDPSSDYLFDHSLSLFYDAASGYFLSPTGNFFIYNPQLNALTKVTNAVNCGNTGDTGDNRGVTGSTVGVNTGVNGGVNTVGNTVGVGGNTVEGVVETGVETGVRKILRSAMRIAKESQNNIKQLSNIQSHSATEGTKSVISGEKGNELKSKNVRERFEFKNESDDECDMDLDNSNSTNKNNKNNNNDKNVRSVSYERGLGVGSICFVCLRMFDSAENLHSHQQLSKLHQTLTPHN